MVVTKKSKKQKTTGFAPTPEDLKLIADLRSKLEPTMGPVTNASILRMGLRVLAERQGVSQ